MFPTPRIAFCAAAAACGILASVAMPRPDARAAPQRQGSACSLRNGDFSNGLDDWIVNDPDVTLDNAEGNPAPSARFYRPSSAQQSAQVVECRRRCSGSTPVIRKQSCQHPAQQVSPRLDEAAALAQTRQAECIACIDPLQDAQGQQLEGALGVSAGYLAAVCLQVGLKSYQQ